VPVGQRAFLGDQSVALGGKVGSVKTKDRLRPALEQPPPAVPGKARIARHSDQTPRRERRAADIEQAVEHARHRPRRSRANRHQQRLTMIAEASPRRLFEKSDALLQAILQRMLRIVVTLDDRGTEADRQDEGWRNWNAGSRNPGKDRCLGANLFRRRNLRTAGANANNIHQPLPPQPDRSAMTC
jgi:hypothetical protein